MTLENAIAEMSARMQANAERFASLGFLTDVRVYYTNKSLEEYECKNKGCNTVWCELKISTPDLEKNDGLIYELYADIDKNGTDIKSTEAVNKSEIETALDELYSAVSEADDPKQVFLCEYERVSAEFDEKMREFEKRISKLRYLSAAAVGIVVISLIIVLIASLL